MVPRCHRHPPTSKSVHFLIQDHFVEEPACADVLYRLYTPTTTTTTSPAKPPRTRPPLSHYESLGCMFSFLFSLSLRITMKVSEHAARRGRASLRVPREGNHRHSGGPVHAARSAPLPCCPCPHSSPPNQCLPTDTTSKQALYQRSSQHRCSR